MICFNTKHFPHSLSLSQIQEETLRTYIFTYGAVYDSLSLHRLSEMFELPLTTVHSIISRMIIKEELLVGHVMAM
jgi:translation initiation factor 3 subunit C